MANKTLPMSNTIIDGKALSRVILGTHVFGSKPDDFCHRMMDMYVAAGGNVFDTAAAYGNGSSESCIGRWLKNKNREDFVICSKCGNPEFKDGLYFRHRLTRKDMTEDLENSFKNLQTDYIDIYFVHKDDPSVPVAEIIDFLNEYTAKGAIRHLGASNWTLQRIGEANAYAEKKGLKGFEFSELAFSLKENSTEGWGENERVLEMNKTEFTGYMKNQMPVFGFNSQAYGYFYKNFNLPESEMEGSPTNKAAVTRLKEICDKTGLDKRTALFATYFGSGLNTFPVVSASTEEHLNELLGSFDAVLDRSDAKYVLGERFY